jgi:hypothetical protein
MIEVVNGVRKDGREVTTILMAVQGLVIRKPMTEEFISRWAAGDEYARSLVEHGEVSVETVTDLVDEDGNDLPDEEREVFTPTAGPGDAGEEKAAPTGDSDAVERATKAEAKVKELQSELEAATSKVEESATNAEAASSSAEGLAAKVEELQKELEAATAPQAFPYDKLTPEALQAEADKRAVTPLTGTGSNGNVVKADLVKALTEADAAK